MVDQHLSYNRLDTLEVSHNPVSGNTRPPYYTRGTVWLDWNFYCLMCTGPFPTALMGLKLLSLPSNHPYISFYYHDCKILALLSSALESVSKYCLTESMYTQGIDSV